MADCRDRRLQPGGGGIFPFLRRSVHAAYIAGAKVILILIRLDDGSIVIAARKDPDLYQAAPDKRAGALGRCAATSSRKAHA